MCWHWGWGTVAESNPARLPATLHPGPTMRNSTSLTTGGNQML